MSVGLTHLWKSSLFSIPRPLLVRLGLLYFPISDFPLTLCSAILILSLDGWFLMHFWHVALFQDALTLDYGQGLALAPLDPWIQPHDEVSDPLSILPQVYIRFCDTCLYSLVLALSLLPHSANHILKSKTSTQLLSEVILEKLLKKENVKFLSEMPI